MAKADEQNVPEEDVRVAEPKVKGGSKLPCALDDTELEIRQSAVATIIGRSFLNRAFLQNPDRTVGGVREDEVLTVCLADIKFVLTLLAWMQRVGLSQPAARTVRGLECPLHIEEELARYWTEHAAPVPFVMAVLSNDLVAACRLADDQELACLHAIVEMAADGHPDSWGSLEKVRAWIGGRTAPMVVPHGSADLTNFRRGGGA